MEEKNNTINVSFVDEFGATRHKMTLDELTKLSKSIDKFEADLTINEFVPNKNAFVAVKTLLHERIKEIQKQTKGKKQ